MRSFLKGDQAGSHSWQQRAQVLLHVSCKLVDLQLFYSNLIVYPFSRVDLIFGQRNFVVFFLKIQSFPGNFQLKVSLHVRGSLFILDFLFFLLKFFFHLFDLELRLSVKSDELQLILFVSVFSSLLISLDSFCVSCRHLLGLIELSSQSHLHF